MSSNLERILCSTANPLVAINAIDFTSQQISRGMGFISETFKGKKKLIVTCRHNFNRWADDSYTYKFMSAALDPSGLHKIRELNLVGEPIYDTRPGSEIAFLIVRDTDRAKTKFFKILPEDRKIPTNPAILYNVKNTSYEKPDLSCGFFLARQNHIKELPSNTYVTSSGGEPVLTLSSDNTPIDTEHMKCRTLSMISRPGFSGSPIWDEKYNLYGMDVGGSEKNSEIGDITACIPNSELYKARQRVNHMIQQTLRR